MRRSHRVLRASVAALLAVAIAALFAIQAREAKIRSDRRIGLSIEQRTDDAGSGVQVIAVEEGLPAERGGIRPGDALVAIGGHPLEKILDYDRAATELTRGVPTPYRILRDGREVVVTVVPGVEFPILQFTADTLALFGYLALALLALFQRPGDVRARLLFLFAAAVSLELALPYQAIGSPTLSAVALSAFYVLTGFQMGTELHLASVIPRRYDWLGRRPWLVPAFYAVGLVLGGLTALTWLVEDVAGRDAFPWTSVQTETLLLGFGLPLWALAVPSILVLQMLRAEEPRGRHQAGLVLAGVVPWTVYVLLLSAFEMQGREIPDGFQALEPLTFLAYPVAIFVAIYRYQLFDIELVVRRSLVYTLLTGTLILVFYAALGAGGAIFSSMVEGGRSVWFVSAVTLALGLVFAPLRRLLQGVIDRKLFPERYALRQRLVALAGELPGLGKLPLMGKHLVERLAQVFAVRSATLLLADPKTGLLVPLASTHPDADSGQTPTFLVNRDDPGVEHLARAGRPLAVEQIAAREGTLGQRLRQLDAVSAVPLLVQRDLIGVLALGPKHRGDRFPGEELELLNLLAHHVATVFQNARLFESATYESLTGLLRREAVLEILSRELDRAQRYDRPLTVGMADLDHFKAINDRYGHLAGDTLLKQVAQVLASGLRSTDSVGRYGGEEFLIVLPETDLAGARVVANKLRALVEEVRTPMEDGEEAAVTISIGLAGRGEPCDVGEPTVRDLLHRADRALYEAKQRGRNRIHPAAIQRVS
ncbi:MAG: diguanylate cyclase [Thermoanaerobaculia bacterium]